MRRVEGRVARYEQRRQHVPSLIAYNINHLGHLIELVRADVRAVSEAELDLWVKIGEGFRSVNSRYVRWGLSPGVQEKD